MSDTSYSGAGFPQANLDNTWTELEVIAGSREDPYIDETETFRNLNGETVRGEPRFIFEQEYTLAGVSALVYSSLMRHYNSGQPLPWRPFGDFPAIQHSVKILEMKEIYLNGYPRFKNIYLKVRSSSRLTNRPDGDNIFFGMANYYLCQI
jgi:hypothetical protein